MSTKDAMRWTAMAALGLSAIQGPALASEPAWPSRPIRLVIGFPPGGGADGVARPVAEARSRELGQPVIVDNKPGGGTTIAASMAATAAPDGYTLFMTNASTYGSLQALYKDFRYTAKDFTPITNWVNSPLLLAVSNDLGVDTVPALIARAKAAPGKLNYASSGVGGGTHLPGVLFNLRAGTEIVHVPYKGGAPALQGLAAGETQLSFATPPSVLPLARAGRLKVIAVTSPARSPLFPDLPTVAEGGAPGFAYEFWWGLVGPAGLPEAIVKRLFDASTKALADPDLRQRLAATGNAINLSRSPADFAAMAIETGAKERELTVASGAAGN